MVVLYFELHLGAAQFKHCSKYAFFTGFANLRQKLLFFSELLMDFLQVLKAELQKSHPPLPLPCHRNLVFY